MIILIQNCIAQKQNNQWRFSGGGGIDFNTNPPTAVSCANMITSEGIASVADRNTGALLFYTNGLTVWNSQNQVMPNGNGLLGGDPVLLSSTTAAVIIPKPSSTTLYYLVTIDEQFGINGVNYSVVDMSLDNGLGDIIAGQKNIPIYTHRNSEKLEVVPAADGINYWLLTHDPNGVFIAFKVSESGIDNTNPVLSNVGISHGNGSGHLKINSQFNRLAMGNFFNGNIELYDFDRTTGIVSNPVVFNFSVVNSGIYGVEFSPNGRFLYVTNLEKVIQYDISLSSTTDIENSGYTIPNNGAQPASLQLGPDAKIYLQDGSIDAINNPDAPGSACNFQQNVIANQIGGGGYGLPKWVYLQETPVVPVNKILYADTCFGSSTSFNLQNTNNVTGVSWNFGDPNSGSSNTSGNLVANHVFSDTGIFTITAVISNISGSSTSTATIRILPLPDAGIINGPSSIEINNTASYSNNIQNGIWSSSNNIVASISSNGLISAINTGSTTISYTATDINGCSNTSTRDISVVPVFVPKKENIYYIPNAFIPGRSNDPDINTLKLYGSEIKAATLKIFNQWGQCIFVSNNPKQKGWDGKYNGVLQAAGTYVYGIQIIFNDGSKISASKSVNLIR